ncbi:unnamed protein product [Parnassius apollo]|uniref:(apollo) hypothetical protein n=1 Tax=Parnassius apollo TaxID=110799 RepID=A0A8S3WZG1_PARAO|nr:unnamed protein product [Parnassius apollo]
MSDKCDEFLSYISTLEAGKKEDKKMIHQLEDKIEFLERASRPTGVEIRNVPKMKGETKDDLCSLVTNLVQSLNLNQNDLKNLRRIKSKQNSYPILLNFNSVLLKDFNKTKDKGVKINTTHLKPKHSKQQVYVSECLTYKT